MIFRARFSRPMQCAILYLGFGLSLTAGPPLFAADSPKKLPAAVAVELPADSAQPKAEIPFEFPIQNGLLATLTAMGLEAPDPDAAKNNSSGGQASAEVQVLKLKKIKGFKRSLKVRVLIRPQTAPLAVLLLGLASNHHSPQAQFWQHELYRAGYHVLLFDSVFSTSFNDCSRHGVPGHLALEATLAANVISAVQARPEFEGRITRVGLLGASYGGLIALHIGKLARDKKIEFIPDRILAFSPPVRTQTAARLLDTYAELDRPKYSLIEMARLTRSKKWKPGEPLPFSDSLMRAGIGYDFRRDLERTLEHTERLYNVRLPAEPASVDRRPYQSGRKLFTRFVELVSYPYWRREAGIASVNELWAAGDLKGLTLATGDNAHVILTRDDPLNEGADLAALQSAVPASRLTVLSGGGHLGYLNTRWARARVARLME